jgi:hypothetical protein
MNEDILAIGGFFFTVIVIVIGLPLVRAYVRQKERTPVLTPADVERDQRLARIETAVETMAVEIERISEGQRFVTRLLAERERPAGVLPPNRD